MNDIFGQIRNDFLNSPDQWCVLSSHIKQGTCARTRQIKIRSNEDQINGNVSRIAGGSETLLWVHKRAVFPDQSRMRDREKYQSGHATTAALCNRQSREILWARTWFDMMHLQGPAARRNIIRKCASLIRRRQMDFDLPELAAHAHTGGRISGRDDARS